MLLFRLIVAFGWLVSVGCCLFFGCVLVACCIWVSLLFGFVRLIEFWLGRFRRRREDGKTATLARLLCSLSSVLAWASEGVFPSVRGAERGSRRGWRGSKEVRCVSCLSRSCCRRRLSFGRRRRLLEREGSRECEREKIRTGEKKEKNL